MAGRKWQKTVRGKEKKDGSKAAEFSKLTSAIRAVVAQSGADPSTNHLLSNLLTRARKLKMPKATLDNAMAGGQKGDAKWETAMFEGSFGTGVMVLVETLTDNRRRTSPQVRKVFNDEGGTFGVSTTWAFAKMGIVACKCGDADQLAQLEDVAIELGAEDIDVEGSVGEEEATVQVLCAPNEVMRFKAALAEVLGAAGADSLSTDITFVPQSLLPLDNQDDIDRLDAFVDALEGVPDVQRVFHNASFGEDEH